MVTALDPNTALVLIDLQNAIVKIPSSTPMDVILAKAAKLVAAFRKAALPIVIVTVDPRRAGESTIRRDAKSPSFSALPDEALAIVPEIKTEFDDIFITKHTWGAFHDTNLDGELKKRGVTGIVLAGVATSRGVESTARAASERGYNIAFAQDAMADIVDSAHENSLNLIFPRLGEVDDTDAIISMLEQLGSR
ncbi:isochorismatase family protein [Spirosoma foliorum]|uniref:Isochorismatase family protein n=1 Tax=Spirosoma foliorum TaxID=2710596 RepID=A0A7G5H509_9BACT|nr:isochorismatase family protein [Spirosoma foliorum]QMW06201.1 isochorismatase family protein [Spirosoma foliorum]